MKRKMVCIILCILGMFATGKSLPDNKNKIPNSNQQKFGLEATFISDLNNWGEGTNTDWFDFSLLVEKITFSHNCEIIGTYKIKVKAKDIFNSESKCGEIEIKTPKHKNIIQSLIIRYLEISQNLFIIPRILLRAAGGNI